MGCRDRLDERSLFESFVCKWRQGLSESVHTKDDTCLAGRSDQRFSMHRHSLQHTWCGGSQRADNNGPTATTHRPGIVAGRSLSLPRFLSIGESRRVWHHCRLNESAVQALIEGKPGRSGKIEGSILSNWLLYLVNFGLLRPKHPEKPILLKEYVHGKNRQEAHGS